MKDQRRTHPRYSVPLECAWNGSSCRASTRIADVSLTGCYVDSPQVPALGEEIAITATINENSILLIGTVVHAQVGMGFGVDFHPLTDPARATA